MNQHDQMRKHIIDLYNAVSKACGDDEKAVKATIKSQGGDYKAIKQARAAEPFNFTDSVRQTLEQFEHLPESSKADYQRAKQALSHVNETPKNEHGSDDVLNKSGNVDMMREALQAVETVLADAYYRHFPECCGQGHSECCGNFIEQWTPEDHKILDTLSPIQRSLQQALAAEPAPLVRLTDEDIKVLQAFHNFNVCTTSDKDLVTFAHAIQDAMQEKNK